MHMKPQGKPGVERPVPDWLKVYSDIAHEMRTHVEHGRHTGAPYVMVNVHDLQAWLDHVCKLEDQA